MTCGQYLISVFRILCCKCCVWGTCVKHLTSIGSWHYAHSSRLFNVPCWFQTPCDSTLISCHVNNKLLCFNMTVSAKYPILCDMPFSLLVHVKHYTVSLCHDSVKKSPCSQLWHNLNIFIVNRWQIKHFNFPHFLLFSTYFNKNNTFLSNLSHFIHNHRVLKQPHFKCRWHGNVSI